MVFYILLIPMWKALLFIVHRINTLWSLFIEFLPFARISSRLKPDSVGCDASKILYEAFHWVPSFCENIIKTEARVSRLWCIKNQSARSCQWIFFPYHPPWNVGVSRINTSCICMIFQFLCFLFCWTASSDNLWKGLLLTPCLPNGFLQQYQLSCQCFGTPVYIHLCLHDTQFETAAVD